MSGGNCTEIGWFHICFILKNSKPECFEVLDLDFCHSWMGYLSLSAESTMFLRANHPCTGIPIGGLNSLRTKDFIISDTSGITCPSAPDHPTWLGPRFPMKVLKSHQSQGICPQTFSQIAPKARRNRPRIQDECLVPWESSLKLPVPDLRTLKILKLSFWLFLWCYVSTFCFEMMQPTFRSKWSTTSSFKRWSPKASRTPDFSRGTWLSQSSTEGDDLQLLKALTIPSSLVDFLKDRI